MQVQVEKIKQGDGSYTYDILLTQGEGYDDAKTLRIGYVGDIRAQTTGGDGLFGAESFAVEIKELLEDSSLESVEMLDTI